MINEISPIKLVKDTIDQSDFDALSEWIKTAPQISKGNNVKDFEAKFSKYVNNYHSVMVNSGSSANLLMLYALICQGKLRNNKVVVPALSWATDLAPVMQLGMEPILCDVNLQDLSVDIQSLITLFEEQKPSVLLLVSVLGLVPDLDTIKKLCDHYDVKLLIDNCEGLGSEYKGRKLEEYGLMSTTSLYIGHIISTGEGGVVCTDDEELNDILLMTRAHGWDRDLSADKQQKLRKKNKVSDFDALYTFYYPGFNFRPTEINGFLGLRQMDKLKGYVQQRNENFKLYKSLLSQLNKDIWLPSEGQNDKVSNLGYPVMFEKAKRNKLIEKFRENNIECRPLISGNLANHPVWYKNYDVPDLPNANKVHEQGMYLPNNPHMTNEEISRVVKVIDSVL